MKNSLNIVLIVVIVAFVVMLGSVVKHAFFPGARQAQSVTSAQAETAGTTDKPKGSYEVIFDNMETKTSMFSGHAYHYGVTFEVVDQATQTKMENNADAIKSAVNDVFAKTKPEDAAIDRTRQKLKLDVLNKIVMQYPDLKIKDITFTNFVYN